MALPTRIKSGVAHGLPFVMGTTGGDRAALMEVTRDSGTYAVIAPNMCKQIVALPKLHSGSMIRNAHLSMKD